MSVSSYKCALVVVSIVFAVGSVRTWDLGVATTNQLQFFKNKAVETSAEDILRQMTAIAYDPVKKDIYVSGAHQKVGSIFRIKTTGIAAYTAVEPIVAEQSVPVHVMAFDHRTSKLYWTTVIGNSINYVHVSDNETAFPLTGKVLLTFEDAEPRGIAIDTCRGYLFWINFRGPVCTIERSRLDGSEPTVLIDELFMASSIAVDLQNSLLYWITNDVNCNFCNNYTIEASDFEGGSRRTLIHGITSTRAYSIALDERDIYWCDWDNNAVWTMPKNTFLGGVSVVQYDRFERPIGLITSTPSLNDTQCIAVTRCHGYCVSGTCIVDNTGRPQCQCPTNATGERCDQTCTDKTCQNGGQCLLDKDGRKLSKTMIGFLFVMVACWGTTTLVLVIL